MRSRHLIVMLCAVVATSWGASALLLPGGSDGRTRRASTESSTLGGRGPAGFDAQRAGGDGDAVTDWLSAGAEAVDAAGEQDAARPRAGEADRRSEGASDPAVAKRPPAARGASKPRSPASRKRRRSKRLRLRLDEDGFETARTKLSHGAHDPKLWEESFREEELEPPTMILTPILGKLLSRSTKKGVSGAVIGVLSFFPASRNPAGPVVPVLTELQTDDRGRFEGEIPIPEEAPRGYPVLAITATESDRRTLSATPVAAVRPGEKNQLGVFWSVGVPSLLRFYSGRGGGALRVVVTGALDPHRWHPGARNATFGYFPSVLIPSAGSSGQAEEATPGLAELLFAWGGGSPPSASLVQGAGILSTRLAERAAKVTDVRDGQRVVARAPFETLSFDEGVLPIAGTVVSLDGPLSPPASITVTAGGFLRTLLTDERGRFFLKDPPSKAMTLRCTHERFVEAIATDVLPGNTQVLLELDTRRPRLRLRVLDEDSQAPLPEVGARVVGVWPHGEHAGEAMPEATATLAPPTSTGERVLDWEVGIRTLTIEKVGYRPATIQDPVSAQAAAGGVLEVLLSRGRELSVRGSDFDALQRSGKWFPDKDNGPGVYTFWERHWIAWDVDFGQTAVPSHEGGSFDLRLGCTNQGIVDHNYAFDVDIHLDGKRVGALNILADSLHVQTARLSLGPLSGRHRVSLVWNNDKYIRGQLDANIRVVSLEFLERPILPGS